MYYSGALYVAATSFCKCNEIEWTGGNLIGAQTTNAESVPTKIYSDEFISRMTEAIAKVRSRLR